MPALPVIANVYRVALHWTRTGGMNAVNVIHVRKASSSASAVATLVDTNVTANMWIATDGAASVDHLTVTPLDGSSASFVFATSGAKWTGGQAGESIPQMAAIVTFRTALRGRSKRGRIYLPFVAEATQGQGTLLSSTVTSLNTGWNAFVNAMAASAGPLVIASYKTASAQDVTSLLAETLAGTQRRRMGRLRRTA